MIETIQVLYKCTCHPVERTVTMVARKDGEDIKTWMERMKAAISRDHGSRSPRCPSRTMTYVKVPIPDAGSAIIGGPVPPRAA